MLRNTTEKIETAAATCTLMFSLESIASSYIEMVNCRVHVIKRWNARCTIAEENPYNLRMKLMTPALYITMMARACVCVCSVRKMSKTFARVNTFSDAYNVVLAFPRIKYNNHVYLYN